MASRRVEGPSASPLIRRCAKTAEVFKAELHKEIQRCGLSERKLAARLGFGPTYLTNLFQTRKDRAPVALRVETLLALLSLLGLSLKELVERVERAEAGRRERRSPAPRHR